MPININITGSEEETVPQEPEGVKFEVVEKDKIEGKLKLRSAMNGDLMILDHTDIDIVVKPKENKIVAFAKETLSDLVYGAESRLLEYLRKNGLIKIDSIQGGNVYGSLEGQLHEGEKVVEVTLMSPDGEYSTELGEVPAEERKGSILQHNLFAPYLYGRYTYE